MPIQAIVNSDDFNRIVAATKKFVSTDKFRPGFQFVKLEFCAVTAQVTAIAVDGHKMSVEHTGCKCDMDMIAYIRPNIRLPGNQDAVIEVSKNETSIRCGGFVFGFTMPKDENCFDWRTALPDEPTFRIAFNANFLIDALQAAKSSVGRKPGEPVVLEFRSATEPVILRTGKDNIKLVMPTRIAKWEDCCKDV